MPKELAQFYFYDMFGCCRLGHGIEMASGRGAAVVVGCREARLVYLTGLAFGSLKSILSTNYTCFFPVSLFVN